jgi:uncharacterized ferritin-like protein (DUF455 family)
MTESISHSFADESIEAKAKWFRILSTEERMDVLVAFTNMILENNPDIVNQKVRPALEDVRILAVNPGNLDSED